MFLIPSTWLNSYEETVLTIQSLLDRVYTQTTDLIELFHILQGFAFPDLPIRDIRLLLLLLAFSKKIHMAVLRITMRSKEIATCGFHRPIAKTKEHWFISKIFSEKKSETRFFRGPLENYAGYLKIAIDTSSDVFSGYN
jgi:hypothetical protein